MEESACAAGPSMDMVYGQIDCHRRDARREHGSPAWWNFDCGCDPSPAATGTRFWISGAVGFDLSTMCASCGIGIAPAHGSALGEFAMAFVLRGHGSWNCR